MDFFSVLALDPPTVELILRGDLDAFAAIRLRERLDEIISRGGITFEVDASAVTFLDAGGIGTLVWLRNSVAAFGGTVTVVAASARFRHIAELTGLGETFGLDLLPIDSLTVPDPFMLAIDGSGAHGTCRHHTVVPVWTGAAPAHAHQNGRGRASR